MRITPNTREEYLQRYPRICAHLIAESLGYAAPDAAAQILKDVKERREHFCEWIYSCYRSDPRAAVEQAIRHRQSHHGYMASYAQALAIVRQRIDTGEGPLFASWF